MKRLSGLNDLWIGITVAFCTKQKRPQKVVAEIRNALDGSPVPNAKATLHLYSLGFIGGGNSEIADRARTEHDGNATFSKPADPASGTQQQLRVLQSLSFSGSKVVNIDEGELVKLNVFPRLQKSLNVHAGPGLKYYSLAVSCDNSFGQGLRADIKGSSQNSFLFVTGLPNTLLIFRTFTDMNRKDLFFTMPGRE